MNKLLKVKCPQCSLAFLYYESTNRPFCSERCKQVDLGHWFQESYVVPVKGTPVVEDESDPEFNPDADLESGNDEDNSDNEY